MLVAPAGMTGEDRAGWVAIARKTLSGIPVDLLERGCLKARRSCRFASEIVPTILSEVEGEWNRRKKRAAEEAARYANRDAPRLAEPDYVSAEEMRKLREDIARGLSA